MYLEFLDGVAAYNGDLGNWDVGQVTNMIIDYYHYLKKDTTHSREILNQTFPIIGQQLGTVSIYAECWYHPSHCKDKRFMNPVEILDPAAEGTAYEKTLKYINALKKKETEIIRDEKIDKLEQRELLVAYSIARHAAAYWYNLGIRDSQYPGAIQNTLNMNFLGVFTTFENTGEDNAAVPAAVLTLYILDHYGRK